MKQVQLEEASQVPDSKSITAKSQARDLTQNPIKYKSQIQITTIVPNPKKLNLLSPQEIIGRICKTLQLPLRRRYLIIRLRNKETKD